MNNNLIKKLNIINASYLFVGKNNEKIVLSVDYSSNKFEMNSNIKNDFYKKVEEKAKDLLKRKSGVNLV